MEIVQMNLEHVSRIAAIEAEVFSAPWSEQGFIDTLAMEHVLFYTALADGQVIGYCGIYLAADEGEITNVAVAPAFRRRKTAWLLLKKTLSEARVKGIRRIFLEVRKSNVAAISLYEKMGFRVAGSRKDFYRFPTEDALVMSYEFADII